MRRRKNHDVREGKITVARLQRRKKITINLNAAMLNWIRVDRIDAYQEQYLEKIFNPNEIAKQYYSVYQYKHQKSWKPFKELKNVFSAKSVKESLTRPHHRMFFEDFNELQEG